MLCDYGGATALWSSLALGKVVESVDKQFDLILGHVMPQPNDVGDVKNLPYLL